MEAKTMVTGARAIEAAKGGAKLYVLNPQRGWIEAGIGAMERAARMDAHALWIYGVCASTRPEGSR